MDSAPGASDRYRGFGATLLAATVGVLATINFGVLLSVLYQGQIHAVYYELRWPGSRPPPLLAIVPIAMATLTMASVFLWAYRRLRSLARDAAPELRRAVIVAWPAALAAIWLIHWLTDAKAGFLAVMAAILALGWAATRFIDSVLCQPQASQFAKDQTNPPAPLNPEPRTPNPLSWWRERPFWVLVGLTLVLTAFHTWVQAQMHRGLQYGSPDIGYYTEMLLNVLRGRGLWSEAFGHHFFGEHFSPGLYLLVPFFAVYPRIECLMVIGALAALSGAWAVYALVRVSNGSTRAAVLLSFAYLLYPSTSRIIYGASYGFHEILLAIPLMLWSFYGYARGRAGLMIVFMLLALSFKEDVAIVYALFGLYVLLFRKRWWGMLVFAGCVLYFVVTIRWIVPAFNQQGTYSKYYLYASLGGTPGGMLAHFFREPASILRRLFGWRALGYAITLTAPLALLALRRPALLAAVPTFAFICLMDTPDFASIRFWHQATLVPVLWLATVEAVGPRRVIRPGMIAGVLICCALTHYALGFSPLSRVWRDVPLQHECESALLTTLHDLIPPDEDVQASARLAAHFIDQPHVYPLHRSPPPGQPAPRWVLIDLNESFTGPEDRPKLEQLAQQLYTSGQHDLVLQADSVLVFRRRDSG